MTLYPMSPKETRAAIVDCFAAQLVPFVSSSPGMGKSSIFAQIAEEFNLQLIDLRLSQCTPEDLMGLPMRIQQGIQMRATFVPFNTFPLAGDDLPPGKDGWLLLLDEFNSASKSVQAAAYKLCLDRFVGQAKLHDNCWVGAAGNLATDKAIVTSLSTAMQSRLIHIQMDLSHSDFMDHAVARKWDSRVLAFLEFKPTLLHKFDPDHNDRTFPCPRTWEFVNKLVTGKASDKINVKLIAGTIGDGAATEFNTFLKVFADLPNYNSIIADPENAKIPRDPGSRYAVISMMIENFSRASFKDAGLYAKRLDPEFQIIYFRGIRRRDPKFIKDPIFVGYRKDLTNFITDDEQAQAA